MAVQLESKVCELWLRLQRWLFVGSMLRIALLQLQYAAS